MQQPSHQPQNPPPSSAFTPVNSGGVPEISLFSQLQPWLVASNQQGQGGAASGPQTQGLTQQQLAVLQQLQFQQFQQQMQQQQQQQQQQAAPTKSESKSSSAYASRHQAAEQRRRNRINERLDKLRTLVPHAERANTASFLEEVIHYIEELQALLKCGPNFATGALPQHPSAALISAAQQQAMQQQQLGQGQQLQQGQQLNLTGLSTAGLAQPGTSGGSYNIGSGPYGLATSGGGFEVLGQQHPMAHLNNMSLGQPINMQQMRPMAMPTTSFAISGDGTLTMSDATMAAMPQLPAGTNLVACGAQMAGGGSTSLGGSGSTPMASGRAGSGGELPPGTPPTDAAETSALTDSDEGPARKRGRSSKG